MQPEATGSISLHLFLKRTITTDASIKTEQIPYTAHSPLCKHHCHKHFSTRRSHSTSPTCATRPIFLHFMSLNVSWLAVSVSLCAPTTNKCVSELSFKQEKQHLKLTPTLGSTQRTEIVSSEGFSEENKTVRNSSCRYELSLQDSQKITAIFVVVRGEFLGSPVWPL